VGLVNQSRLVNFIAGSAPLEALAASTGAVLCRSPERITGFQKAIKAIRLTVAVASPILTGQSCDELGSSESSVLSNEIEV